jgi:hypothetical protein
MALFGSLRLKASQAIQTPMFFKAVTLSGTIHP